MIILSHPHNKPSDTRALEEAKSTGNKEAGVQAFLRGENRVANMMRLLKFLNLLSDKIPYRKGL